MIDEHVNGASQNRYYYTDPLAAAWMARQFLMLFMIEEHPGFLINAVHYPPAYKGKWFIHSSSLYLLEPNRSDIVLKRTSSSSMILQLAAGEESTWGRTLLNSGGRILERDGKPFHWPECEAI